MISAQQMLIARHMINARQMISARHMTSASPSISIKKRYRLSLYPYSGGAYENYMNTIHCGGFIYTTVVNINPISLYNFLFLQ